MVGALLRRLGASVVVVWVVLSLTFLVHYALPSDPARAMAGPQARPHDVTELRIRQGLDKPLWLQYSRYIGRLAKGDLGDSYQQHSPVAEVLKKRVWNTAKLGTAAVAIQIIVGTFAGVVAALRRGTWLDHSTIALTLFGISAPTFLTGMILQYWLAYRWQIVPFDGFPASTLEQLRALVLPACTLGLFGAAFCTRLVRDEVIGILNQDYMRTARAKGLSPARIILVHGLRNALIPIITIVGMDLGTMMGGAIVTEKLFRFPGIGSLAVDAVLSRDGPIVMGIVIITSTAVVIANLAVDTAFVLLDPRTRRPTTRH